MELPAFYDLKQSIENLHAKNDLGSLLLRVVFVDIFS